MLTRYNSTGELTLPSVHKIRLGLITAFLALPTALGGCGQGQTRTAPEDVSYKTLGLSDNPVGDSKLSPGTFEFIEVTQALTSDGPEPYFMGKTAGSTKSEKFALVAREALEKKQIIAQFRKGDLLLVPLESGVKYNGQPVLEKDGHEITMTRVDFTRVLFQDGHWGINLISRVKDGNDELRSEVVSARVKEVYSQELGLPKPAETITSHPTEWFFPDEGKGDDTLKLSRLVFIEVVTLAHSGSSKFKLVNLPKSMGGTMEQNIDLTQSYWKGVKDGDLLLVPYQLGKKLKADGSVTDKGEVMFDKMSFFLKKGDWKPEDVKSRATMPPKCLRRFMEIFGKEWKEKVQLAPFRT